MQHLQMPLSDTEEAVLQLLNKVSTLEEENKELKQIIKQLRWTIEEHD
jgi:peptidoglycan hydrolase CwlO-like protein